VHDEPTTDHLAFFRDLDWFAEDDCARLDDELAWARTHRPVVHTDYDGGMHVVTTYDGVRTVGDHPELFSSAMPGVQDVGIALPPLDADLPLHRDFRSFLNRYFSRSHLERTYRAALEAQADELVDGFAAAGRVELVSEFATPFTARSLARVVLDDPDADRQARAVAAVHTAAATQTPESFGAVAAVAAELMAERTGGTGPDDLLQGIVSATVSDGRPLTTEEALGIVTVLMLGGLDTTRGVIAGIGEHLATVDGLEERLRRPDWARTDLDEFLRLSSTVSVMGRVVTQDTDVLGCPMHAGDRVAVHFRSANRDATRFDRPGELVPDRERVPHLAFGRGIHRCLGQHFARLQLEIAVDRLLARVTNLRLAPGTTIPRVAGVSNRAPAALHLEFDRR
jgi:cytochrome P450